MTCEFFKNLFRHLITEMVDAVDKNAIFLFIYLLCL